MISENDQLHDLIRATQLRLRKVSPFFAALSLFSKVEFITNVPIAATDGIKIYFHPLNFSKLKPSERDAIFLHELLHIALLHPSRKKNRDSLIFNIAADIVVNGMIAELKYFKLPEGAIRDLNLEDLSVEEIYEIIQSRTEFPKLEMIDLIKGVQDKDNLKEKDENKILNDIDAETYWKRAINNSLAMTSSKNQGNISNKLKRNLDQIVNPQLDWKTILWRYLVKTPSDFSGFDRRFLYRELYLEELSIETLEVFCCIDTSGSISQEILSKFISELKGILSSYPLIKCQLFYADSECYGPYDIDLHGELPIPKGGGGTDFAPFFKAIKDKGNYSLPISVYLTDGYGSFPEETSLETLWVITPGGIKSEDIPFGEVCRLI